MFDIPAKNQTDYVSGQDLFLRKKQRGKNDTLTTKKNMTREMWEKYLLAVTPAFKLV